MDMNLKCEPTVENPIDNQEPTVKGNEARHMTMITIGGSIERLFPSGNHPAQGLAVPSQPAYAGIMVYFR
jgi:hypothetical protein